MIKIKVFRGTDYKIVEVTEETYKIIERKVIEAATANVELQIFLRDASITLPKLMESAITEEIAIDAILESKNYLIKKLHENK
jgi:hypothetical protein